MSVHHTMKAMKRLLLFTCLALLSSWSFGQRGKDGAGVIAAAGTQVNAYTTLTADATAGTNTITVASNALGTNFGANLAAGDLIFIYQAQGADMTPTVNSPAWGEVTGYNNCGNYEFAEVVGTTAGTGITLSCALQNDYTAAGNVQVVRVPRYTSLTVNGAGSITCPDWNGSTGGLVIIESDGDATINGSIDASGSGFRGGALDANSTFSANWVSTNGDHGAEKGEGIGGDWTVYDGIGGRYCRASPANGGGGASAHNCGGGGGANSGPVGLTWTGFGRVDPTYNTAWALEAGWLPNHSRAGGGKGGYSHSSSDQNALVVGPDNSLWGADWRRPYGGQGGRVLDYSTGKIFMGGGGGAGDQNNADGGAGGNGGGLVFIAGYGNVGGSGTIISNGDDGGDTDPSNPPFGGYSGNDGAGGAGAGGTVIVNANGTVSCAITCNGGEGGDQLMAAGAFGTVDEAEGPGGGGGGGYIAVSAGTPTRTANWGDNGVTTSPELSEFPPNGATRGNFGRTDATIDNYFPTANDVTVCAGIAGTLTATINGTAPAGTTIGWYDAEVGGTLLGTGTTYSPGVIGATTTYYVGLCPGHYRIPVQIIVSPAITIDITNLTITDETCLGNDGAITGIVVSGGTPPLIYDWNGTSGSLGPDTTGIAGGSYTLTVTDAAGCTETTGPHVVGTGGGPTVDITNINITDATCGNSNGGISGIVITSGSGSYSYDWNSGAYSTLDISNVPGGSYTLDVTDLNTLCVTTVGPFTIGDSPVPTIDITNMVLTDENCANADGAITGIVVSSGTAPLIYDWNGTSGSLGPDTTGVAAGNYTLTVTDANGCTASTGPHNIINNPAPTLDITNMVITDENCGGLDGAITGIVVNGGTGPFTYDWNGTVGSLSPDTTGLAAGGYTLTVTDANGCVVSTGPHTVNGIGGPVIDITNVVVVDETCTSADGEITGITVSGGSGNYTYDWNGSTGSISADTIGLGAGNYTLTVTDIANGCTSVEGPFAVIDNPAATIDISNIAIANDTCNNTVGAITGIVVTGGTAPLVFDWNGTTTLGADTVGLGAGNYTLTVTDANNCVATNGPHSVIALPGPTIDDTNVALADENCGNADGSITGIVVSGGNAPLTYDWNGTVGSVGPDSVNIGAGSYTLTVVDAFGCSASSGPYTINNIPAPTINIGAIAVVDETCSNVNGEITGITVSGGSGNYSYDWNGTSTLGPDTIGLAAGNYTLTVTDNVTGCTSTFGPQAIVDNAGPTLNISGLTLGDDTCVFGNGFIVGIVASGGTAPLIYDWNGSSGSLGADTTGLGAGNYTLTVTDANGCTVSTGPYTINALTGPTIDDSNILIINENCGGQDGAIVNITASGGNPPLNYSWNGVSTFGIDTLALNAGSYNLTVTDDYGCTATSGPYTVNSIGGPVIDTTNIAYVQETCSGVNGAITGITASGGSGNFIYDWNGSSTLGLDTIGLGAGNYTLTVTDTTSGCVTLMGPVTITDSPAPIIDLNALVVADDTCNAGVGEISGIVVTGGTAPLVYEWNGTATATPDTLGLSAGTYTLTVTDANGCTATAGPFTVNPLAGPTIDDTNITIVDENCGGFDGSITGITVSGGTAPLSYDWNGAASTSPDTLNIVAGAWTFTVTDANGCSATSGAYNVSNIGGPTVDVSGIAITNEDCGNGNGIIAGITATGVAPLSYSWNGNTTLSADTIGLNAGAYTLTVTDANGCSTVVGPFNIVDNPADPIVLTLNNVDTVLCSPDSITLSATVSGGGGLISLVYSGTGGQIGGTLNVQPTGGGTSTYNLQIFAGASDTICITATDACGQGPEVFCFVVTVGSGPVADFTFVGPVECGPGDVTFTNNSANYVSALWDFGGSGTSTLTDPVHTFVDTGCHNVTLTVTDAIGCSDSFTSIVCLPGCNEEIIVPNIFSPNGDGQNDVFSIQGLSGSGHSMFIYNRWGQLMYSTEDYLNNWDGYTQSGVEVPEGTYYFVLGVEGGEEIQGHVTLVR